MRNTLVILLKAVIAILVGATIGSLLGEFNYALDLFSNFKVHVATVLTLTIFVFWYLRQTMWAMLSLACTCIHLIAIAPWILQGEGQLDITGDSVGVLLSNIGMNRGDLQKLATLINEEQPEIVGLLEVTPRILSNLNLDSNEYRYRLEYPTTAGYEGLALYSKLPVSDGNIVRFGATASPTLVANITIGKNKIEFILTHPHWPLGLDRAARRNSQLQQMSAHIGESDWTVLLAGDLNTTMWSAHYKEFEAGSGGSKA